VVLELVELELEPLVLRLAVVRELGLGKYSLVVLVLRFFAELFLWMCLTVVSEAPLVTVENELKSATVVLVTGELGVALATLEVVLGVKL